MAYKIEIDKYASKFLATINEPYYSAIRKSIYDLADNPRPYGYKKLKDRDGYRIRVGPYRIIYDIHDKILTVEVLEVGNRKDIYD